ncbi:MULTISPECIES: tetratricopeptide repeat protein [unclassified Rhizobium]|uniref:tetratricopeptide repeat protein n=1 Tax=unclassified Rhizobium TaxID=2613769 RepID=UPI001FD5EDE6|nr:MULTISPECIES: hypothetical protein [unclassified Rhizobium]
MIMGEHEVSENDARAEAERLLADPRLHVSDRHRAFLKYIIDARFEGRTSTVKAYSVAIDVFNRPPSFNPSSDPIVRIEATRLRETLQKYYQEIASEAGARLEIPRGRYVPFFVERNHPPCPLEEDAQEDVSQPEVLAVQPTDTAPPAHRERWRNFSVAVGLLLVLAGGAYAFIGHMTQSPPYTRKPLVSLLMAPSQDIDPAGAALLEKLALSIARFGTMRLQSASAAPRSALTAPEQTAYEVRLRYLQGASFVSVWWQVSDSRTGEAVWTDEDRRESAEGSTSDNITALVQGVSRKLAGQAGAINAIELRRGLPKSTTGNVCVLRGERAVELRDLPGIIAARGCLEATIEADPSDADAMGTLARVRMWTGRMTGDKSYFGPALDLANRAASVSPTSVRAALAQLATQYQAGQIDMSIAAARRGLALNPENADLLAKLAMATFLNGQWDEGLKLAQQAADVAGQPLKDASFVMVLDAYRRGQYAQAVFLARQVPAADTVTAAIRIAAVARTGDRAATDKEIASARLQHPNLDRMVASIFEGTRCDPELEAALREGFRQAGLSAPVVAVNGSM